MIDLNTFACLLVPALAVMAVVTHLTTRRPRKPIADIDPRTGRRTDAH